MRIIRMILVGAIAVLAFGGIAKADDERKLIESIALMTGAKRDYCIPLQGKKRVVCEKEHDALIKRMELCLDLLKLRSIEVTETMTTVYQQDLLLVQVQSKYLGRRYFVPKQSQLEKK